MERPTCRTCPHLRRLWEDGEEPDKFQAEEYTPEEWEDHKAEKFGVCLCHAPSPIVYPMAGLHQAMVARWPTMSESQGCGEHPDFPAYIAATRAKPAEVERGPLGAIRGEYVIFTDSPDKA